MYQYLNRAKWLVHIQKHIEELESREREGKSIFTYPHPEPRCPNLFHSVLHLQFHLEDIHGIPMRKVSKAKKVLRGVSERVLTNEKQHTVKKERLESCLFINNTATTIRTSSRRISKTSSGNTTPSYSSQGSTWGEKEWSDFGTLPLSDSRDAKDNLASDLDFVVIDKPDTDFVMIDKLSKNTQPSHSYQMPVVDLNFGGEELQEVIQHTTIKLEYKTVNKSQETSNRSTPSCSDSNQIGSDSPSGYDTPLSSAFSENLINQAISPLTNLDHGGIEVVDLTESNNVPQSSAYITEASESAY
jgi:hypothetical protein